MLTSFYPMYVLTANVVAGAAGVSVENLTRPFTGCLHDYQLTPDDMRRLSRASILVINGAGMESFLARILGQKPDLPVVEASSGVELIMDRESNEPNPHVWLSVANAIHEVRNIAGGLSKINPANAGLFKANAEAYIARLEALNHRMHVALAPAAGRHMVTLHEAFPYFARDFGLVIAAVIEREPGSEPSAAELAEEIRTVRKLGRMPLFVEPQYPSASAAVVARETGSPVYTLDPVVTGKLELDAYEKLMEQNLTVLVEAFSQ